MPSRHNVQRRPTEPFEVRIERLGAEADGIARLPDGSPVYVPRTLPGETVLARPVAQRGGGWHAEATAIIDASPGRTVAPCPHFGPCGGCGLQHWQDTAYREWKSGLLSRALQTAGFDPPSPMPFHPSLPGERRRLDFAVRRSDSGIRLGLHAARSADVVDLTDCLILIPPLMQLMAPLRRLLAAFQGLWREASVIANWLDNGADLLLRTDAEPVLADRTALAGFARAHKVARISVAIGQAEPETVCQLQPATVTLHGVPVSPPPGAFLQATASGEQAIVDAVLAGLPVKLSPKARVAELYAGSGTLTFALAQRLRVSAYEGNAAAFASLRQAVNHARLAGRIEAAQRDLVRQPLAAEHLSGFAAVVLDPPHAGAAAQMGQIAASRVPVVIYVSCNPATLSRDARLLHDAGYRLAAASAIDQFLWSPRLESVCVFKASG